MVLVPGPRQWFCEAKEGGKPHHWRALMMLNQVVVIRIRQAQLPRRVSVASEMILVHQIMRVVAIAIAIERRRAALGAAYQEIAVV